MKGEEHLLVGQLAKAAGISADAVRFYEKHGLVPEPARTAAGYRLYDRHALQRLRFIRKAQAIGFSLAEIRRILNLRGNGQETCRCVISTAEATLEETERKVRELTRLADSLRAQLERWRAETLPCDAAAEFCALIENAAEEPNAASSPDLEGGSRRSRLSRAVSSDSPEYK